MKKAKQLINKYIKDNDCIVIGVSGGPDSMALLDLVVKSEIDCKIICAHINHNLRKESYDEKIMVEQYCKAHNIIFEYMLIEKYNKDNFHNDAREKRYDFYESLIKKYKAKYLLTAHHGDDLIETMLMRIVRGSTLKGYSGFNEQDNREGYIVLRPLIHNTKEEILDYIIGNKVPYAIDYSNEKDIYTRNRFRKYILPRLKQENNNVHNKFYDLSTYLLEINEFLNSEAVNKLGECYSDRKLDLNIFNNYPSVIKKEILRIILKDIYKKDINLIKNVHLNQILNLNKANSVLNFPKNIKIIKSYDYITFDNSKTIDCFRVEINNNVELPNGKRLEMSKCVNDNSNNVIKLSSEEIKLPLIVRNRKKGDRIILKGMNHHKKIKDIFIDEKIAKEERNMIPIVEDSEGKIVWIPGIKKSKFDKSNEEKCDIIIKYI